MKITGNIKLEEENRLTVTTKEGTQHFLTGYFEDKENFLECTVVFMEGDTTPAKDFYYFKADRNGKTAAEIEKYFINEFTKVVH